jgi:hypothetical protein
MVGPPHRSLTCLLEYHSFERLANQKKQGKTLYGGHITIPIC